MHVRVRLLDLVQQDHGIGLAPYRLGQHTALAIADVPRRCALERGHGMRFLILAHVDGDDVLFAPVQHLGQRQRGFRLAHAGRPREHEHPDGLRRVVEPRAACLDALGNHFHRVILPDHPLGEVR